MTERFAETISKFLTVHSEKGFIELIALKEVYVIVKTNGETVQIKPKKVVFQFIKRDLQSLNDLAE